MMRHDPAHVMLTVEGPGTCGAAAGMRTLHRRAVLRRGIFGAAGLLWGSRMAWGFAPHLEPTAEGTQGKAKAVIQIWLWGGPAHIDTFDPKPDAGYDYCGPLDKPISTNVDGLRIGQLLPELAKIADRYSVIRSMAHGVNAHETASYLVQTGRMPGDRYVYPCVGAVVSYFQGQQAPAESHASQGLIPPYIVLTEPQGRFSEAGFLGPRYKPFATGGDPARTPFAVEGIVSTAVSTERQKSRRELLQRLDTFRKAMRDEPNIAEFIQAEETAYDLILGDSGKAFEPSEEADAVRERYGRNTFGQSCLVARRLVERGVRYITINYKGWDTHKQHFQTMQRKLPEFDRGLSALLSDLSDRGLLDSTIVWCCGEFGRTPKVLWEPPWSGGRNHWGRAFSVLVAGGGFRAGRVVGSTDAKGEDPKDKPVHPTDLIAAMYQLLGIDPTASLRHPSGDMVRLTPEPENGKPLCGYLREIL